ncbi:TonB-dependent receptor plug domain-containing protein [Nitrospira sp. T9]|uniref:TonB-dependent receptor plug domain-containing protein n=1 Tax=unclassified Nitrospira TaxID=2652172 RepID=UPI003F964233
MEKRFIHFLFSGLIGGTLCLFANTNLYAGSEEQNQTTPAAIDLALIKEDLEFLKEENVSIAAAHEQPISEAPSNVYVITDADIRQSGATDLPTVLRRIPGLEVIQMTGADFNVSMRGDNQSRANKLLVLVDGRSIYLDPQGEMLWKAIPITLPEIKQIEVLKGPASAIYGFNAYDGVINIITKSAEEMKGLTVQAGGGEFSTVMLSAIYGGRFEDLSYRISYGYDQTNEWDDRDKKAFGSNKFNIATTYALPDDTAVKLSGGFLTSSQYEGPIVDTVVISQEPEQGYVNAAYEGANYFLRGYWTNLQQPGDVNAFSPNISPFISFFSPENGSSKQNLNWNSYNVEGQHRLRMGATSELTYGLNYRYNSTTSNFLSGSNHENRLGLYVQEEWKPISMLTAVAGLRFDMDTYINPTYSPRGSLIFKPSENHSFRLTAAIAYRAPTIFETHTDSRAAVTFPGFPPFVPPSTTIGSLTGSENLKPEKITSYELAYQGWFFKHRLRTQAAVFLNNLKDLIGQENTGVGPSLTFANASGEATIQGVEGGAEFLMMPWLTGFANVSYQDISQSLVGRVRRGGPQWKVNGGLRADLDNGLNGEAAFHFVGSADYPIGPLFTTFSTFPGGFPAPNERVGSYILLNLRGGYRFWNNRAELAVSAFNALNDKHKENPLGETIKSRVLCWLTIRLP